MYQFITTPGILTDAIYEEYGGTNVSIASNGQKQASYLIAEEQMAQEITTPVTETTFTGTYSWPKGGRPMMLEHTRLVSVGSVTGIYDGGCNCAADAVEISGCAWIKSHEAGIVDLKQCGSSLKASCSGCGASGGAYQVRIAYTAGLPTAAATDPRLLMALVTVADLALEQIVDPAGAEGGPGDIGVQGYSTTGYSETRTPLRMTAFGASARANYAANMVKHLKVKRAMGIGY